jgi:hypothetical protein
MPFNNTYTDFDKQRYPDSRDYFISLAKFIVKEPLSTHIVKTVTPFGKIRYLVIDRARVPAEGDMVIACTDRGLRVGRLRHAASMKNIWGKVIWSIHEG